MKELTERRITEYRKKELFNQKSMYEFIDVHNDPKLIKKYKCYELFLFASGLCFLIGIITTILLGNSSFILVAILFFVPLYITNIRLRRYFRDTESLRKETYNYFLSKKLIRHLKVVLKMSKEDIAKYEERCIKRADKSTTLSFAAFFGILFPIAPICYAIFTYLHKGKIMDDKILVPIIIFIASIMWLLFRSIYTDIMNRENNSYKRLAELLSENNYN